MAPQEDFYSYAALCADAYNKPCTSGPFGRAWQLVMGGAMDVEYDRFWWAKMIPRPELTPTDALFYLAAERGLERVILIGTGGTLEDETLHRRRLKDAWGIWERSGTQAGHIEAFGWAGLGAVQVLRRVDFSTPPPVGSPYVRIFAREVWSQFDILIRKPMAISEVYWGAFTWGDGTTWGTTMSAAEIQQLRRLVRDHKSAHDTGTYFHFAFANGALWGTFKYGDGTLWGGSGGSVTTIICGEKFWENFGYM